VKKFFLVSFLIAIVIFVGVASTTPTRGGTMVIAYWGDPISFNPDAQIDDAGYGIYGSIFSKLVTLDASYNVIPDLAESWDISKDGLTYTFHLRKGVKWQDGQPCTAADVVWTFDQIMSGKAAPAHANFAAVDSVEAPNDYTVVIKMKRPYSAFLSFLAWYGTFIMPKHLYDITENGSPVSWLNNPYNQHPIGTGPFKFVKWVKGAYVILTKNPDYFLGEPYLDGLVFDEIPDQNTALQSFLNGEVDFDDNVDVSQLGILKKMPHVLIDDSLTPSRYYLAFNVGRRPSPFHDKEVRFAVAYALNREQIFNLAIKYGEVAEGFYTPAIPWAYNPSAKIPDYNVKLANEMLDKAGYPLKNGTRFTVTLVYFQGQEWSDMAKIIKEQLAKVGIQVNLEEYELATYIQKVLKGGDFDLTLLDGFQGPDPDNLVLRVGTGGDINVMGYSNPEVDKLLSEASQASNIEERAKYYFEVQTILSQDLPIYPIAEVVNTYAYKDYVEGLPFTLTGIGFNNYAKTWLKK